MAKRSIRKRRHLKGVRIGSLTQAQLQDRIAATKEWNEILDNAIKRSRESNDTVRIPVGEGSHGLISGDPIIIAELEQPMLDYYVTVEPNPYKGNR
jgi:hypothetical protein